MKIKNKVTEKYFFNCETWRVHRKSKRFHFAVWLKIAVYVEKNWNVVYVKVITTQLHLKIFSDTGLNTCFIK